MNALCGLARQYGPLVGRILMKNVAILGGLIFVMGMGAGPLSVDHRKRAS